MKRFFVLLIGTPLYASGFLGTGVKAYWEYSSAPSGDGGVVVCNGNLLFKLNPSGSVVWTKHLPVQVCFGVAFVNSSYLVFEDYNSDINVYSISQSGTQNWGYTYIFPTSYTYGRGAVWTGSAYLVLFSGYFSSKYYPMILALDPSGNVLWAKKYSIAGAPVGIVPHAGGYVITFLDTLDRSVILKIDASGNPISAKYVNIPVSSDDVYPVEMGGYLYIVSSENIVKLDASLNVVWAKVNSSYLVSYGATTDGSALYSIYGDIIAKIDPSGNVIWAKKYIPTLSTFYLSITHSGSNVYAIGGSDVYTDTSVFISIPTNSPLSCEEDVAFYLTDATYTSGDLSITSLDITVSKGSSVSVSDSSYSLNIICSPVGISEKRVNASCKGRVEVYDLMGRRYENVPQRSGIFFIVTEEGVKKAIRR